MSQIPNEKLTLEKLLYNAPEEFDIPGLGKILLREPTKGEKIQARADVLKMPEYEKLSEIEQGEELNTRLIPYCIIEPKITYDEFLKMPQSNQMAIYDMVTMWLAKKNALLSDKRKKYIRDFLQQMRGMNPEISLKS